jgi:hypothetical protein
MQFILQAIVKNINLPRSESLLSSRRQATPSPSPISYVVIVKSGTQYTTPLTWAYKWPRRPCLLREVRKRPINMMISCPTSVAAVTATLYRPSSGFVKAHALNSFDHLARPFIGQYRKSFAKVQDATRDPPLQHLSRSSTVRRMQSQL